MRIETEEREKERERKRERERERKSVGEEESWRRDHHGSSPVDLFCHMSCKI